MEDKHSTLHCGFLGHSHDFINKKKNISIAGLFFITVSLVSWFQTRKESKKEKEKITCLMNFQTNKKSESLRRKIIIWETGNVSCCLKWSFQTTFPAPSSPPKKKLFQDFYLKFDAMKLLDPCGPVEECVRSEHAEHPWVSSPQAPVWHPSNCCILTFSVYSLFTHWKLAGIWTTWKQLLKHAM